MSKDTFKPALEQIVADWKAAQVDSELSLHEHLRLAADAAEVIETLLRDFGGNDEDFNQLVSDCEWAIQNYVVPIDLTKYRVPKYVEQFFIDPQLVQAVRPALMALRQAISAEQSPATTTTSPVRQKGR